VTYDAVMPVDRFSTASLVTSIFPQEIIQDLDLAGHGLEIIPREPSVVGLFPDGRSLALGSDSDRALRA
jgi:phytoene dehydrogenase-like protein